MLKLYFKDSLEIFFFIKLFVKYPPAHVASILKEYHCGILVPDKNDNLAGEADI